MALAATAFAKATRRRQIMAATSSIGPGALNMVTAAAVAHANRLPLLLLAGDTFQSRIPDPVLQQVEHFGSPSTTVNDAFRPVTRYWDRITRPEQVVQSLPLAVETMLDPADCGPAFIGLPQDVQAEAYDYPEALFGPRVHEPRRPRADRRSLEAAAAALRAARRPLLIAGGGVHYSLAEEELARFAEAHGIPVVETVAGKSSPRRRPPELRRADRRHRLRPRQPARSRGRPRPRRRHAAAGLHNGLVDRVRRRDGVRRPQRRPLRCDEALRAAAGRRCARRAAPSSSESSRGWRADEEWTARGREEATAFRRFVAETTRPGDGGAHVRAGHRRRQRAAGARRLRRHRGGRLPRRAERQLAAEGRRHVRLRVRVLVHGLRDRRRLGSAHGTPRGRGDRLRRRRLVPDAQLRALQLRRLRPQADRGALRQRRLRGDRPAPGRPGRRAVQQPLPRHRPEPRRRSTGSRTRPRSAAAAESAETIDELEQAFERARVAPTAPP